MTYIANNNQFDNTDFDYMEYNDIFYEDGMGINYNINNIPHIGNKIIPKMMDDRNT